MSSAWRHSSFARHLDPRSLSELTLLDLDKSPMFNPLEYGTKIPAGQLSTGIVPEGIYYMNKAAKSHCCNKKQPVRTTTARHTLIDEFKKMINI